MNEITKNDDRRANALQKLEEVLRAIHPDMPEHQGYRAGFMEMLDGKLADNSPHPDNSEFTQAWLDAYNYASSACAVMFDVIGEKYVARIEQIDDGTAVPLA